MNLLKGEHVKDQNWCLNSVTPPNFMFVKFVLEASGLWNYFPGFQVSKTKIKVIPVSNLPEKNKGVSIPPSAICYCLGFLKIAILTVIHLCEILLKRAILEIIEIFSTSKLRNYNKNFDNMKFWQPKPVTSQNFINMKYYSKIGPVHAPPSTANSDIVLWSQIRKSPDLD